jgi:splicing factor 3A subunit 2
MSTDFQHREGSTASAGIASAEQANVARRERLRNLALETTDLSKDPYFMKNHLGSYECKLCLTLHNNEGSYLAHTQGKKHQGNLARRAAREEQQNLLGDGISGSSLSGLHGLAMAKKNVPSIKIGIPEYHVTKLCHPDTQIYGILVQVHYPHITAPKPVYRFMASFEQKVEPSDKKYQYLVLAAEPYSNIAFKIPSNIINLDARSFVQYWDDASKQYSIQFLYRDYKCPSNTE